MVQSTILISHTQREKVRASLASAPLKHPRHSQYGFRRNSNQNQSLARDRQLTQLHIPIRLHPQLNRLHKRSFSSLGNPKAESPE